MWKCKHCLNEFDFTRTTEKGNHAKHCEKNPKRAASYAKLRDASDNRFGKKKKFEVVCKSCDKPFNVIEREKLHPMKDQYFCSRVCANSVGGKAKALKYGYTQYRTIAAKYHKEECVVCGVTDILDVHHLDENRENNDASNLVFLCPNDHYRLHRNNDEKVKRILGLLV